MFRSICSEWRWPVTQVARPLHRPLLLLLLVIMDWCAQLPNFTNWRYHHPAFAFKVHLIANDYSNCEQRPRDDSLFHPGMKRSRMQMQKLSLFSTAGCCCGSRMVSLLADEAALSESGAAVVNSGVHNFYNGILFLCSTSAFVSINTFKSVRCQVNSCRANVAVGSAKAPFLCIPHQHAA